MAKMCLYEICSRNAVAIGKQDVIRGRGTDGLVQNTCFTEPRIFMPNVFDGEVRLFAYLLDGLTGIVRGTIVCHDDFEILVGLGSVSPQYQFKPAWRVISRHDDGYTHRFRS